MGPLTEGTAPPPGRRLSVARHLLAIGLVCAIATPSSAEAQGSATLVGQVFTKEGGNPLGYSNVAVAAQERFTDATGRFVITGLPAGTPLSVRVRHLGYSVVTVSVNIPPGKTDSIRVELAAVAHALPAVAVSGSDECLLPGEPSVEAQPVFASIFDQLRQNAEQYRMLGASYPFEETMTWQRTSRTASGKTSVEGRTTFVIDSRGPWNYTPGRLYAQPDDHPASGAIAVLIPAVLDKRRSVYSFWIPTLSQIAAPLFFASHCFSYRGLEDGPNGSTLIRIDFAAWSQLSTPDVNGSFYLDASSYQLQRSEMRLSRNPRSVPFGTTVEFMTFFTEIAPSIRIASLIAVEQRFTNMTDGDSWAAVLDTVKMTGIRFANGKPGQRP